MLFAKSAFLLSLFALGNIAAAADSSACLLSALGPEKRPGDLKAVCVDRVRKNIEDACSDDEKEDALKQFADTCSSAGHKVVINSSTSSADSSTGTSTGGSKSTQSATTGTGFATASATSTSSSGSGSGSGSSSNAESSPSSTSEETPLQTNSAGSSDKHVSAAAFAAVVFVGFAATL
ncbi:hypothetical protein P170DRAFT_432024 [Aspergillus steynii IBT 23096]|uniref:GPI anchored cell wall protein n=1 Tax=Aspergillus steynii IBT 23096 TaxID=1392250 RepID=A0A2I2GND4_9EURO|nr:uncharacterized protein P170DRAFT_432024 [Aspergillus steynii IBT 23096]PLB54387.1 hypothetical protein P170DRAFT_432024 [Aspergillus steynii IBT 23096]